MTAAALAPAEHADGLSDLSSDELADLLEVSQALDVPHERLSAGSPPGAIARTPTCSMAAYRSGVGVPGTSAFARLRPAASS